MNIPSEQELVKNCINDDRKSQKLLFDAYKKAMFNIAYRITNDYELSNDILQESFIQVFNDIKDFKQKSTLGAWIKTITVRTSLRKVKNKISFESLDDHTGDQIIEWQDSLDAADLDKTIRSLPEGFRTVFLLIEKEGYKHKEVAQMLGINEGTSKSQLHRAKKMLQQKLNRY